MVALKKIMLKTAQRSRRQGETLLLLKSSENLRDPPQTSREPFSMQYRWKQRNPTAHKPKHIFPAI